MAFGDLAAGGLERFLTTDRLTDELCAFIHIPKTAGSSYGTELRTMRPPYTNVFTKFDPETGAFSHMDDAMEAFVSGPAIQTARSCSGHFTYQMAAPIRAARPETKFITFLREPVARVISDFRYARSPTHPTFRDMIAMFPTIESYIASPRSQNKMARFLLPKEARSREQIEAIVDTRFAFIGVLELYPMSFNILSRLMGHDRMPTEHKRKTESTRDNAVDESEDLRNLIAANNRRDRLLYNIVRQKLSAIRREWMASRRG